MLVQNYGWPTGPAKTWLWLARRPFGWPRASGKHDPCVPKNFNPTYIKLETEINFQTAVTFVAV